MAETKCLWTDHNSHSLFPVPLGDVGAGREIGESLERLSLEKGVRGKVILVVIVSHYPTLLLIGNKSNSSS